MKRRTLLAGVATSAVGLSGCLAEGIDSDGDAESSDGDDGDSGDGSSDAGGSDDAGSGSDGAGSDGGDDGPPSIEDSTIRTTAKNCGSTDAGEATAERGDDEVTVEGLITASNPCHRAVLDEADVRDQQLVLRVDVEREDDACQMCIGEIEYRATVSVANADALQGTLVEHVDGGEHGTDWSESEDASQ